MGDCTWIRCEMWSRHREKCGARVWARLCDRHHGALDSFRDDSEMIRVWRMAQGRSPSTDTSTGEDA